ncbi:cardiolipin synthase [Niallia taxi]|uniref:cardiolipin synthase n=1 Tax=Niallia taxi TaxID=2499688 RepID=UPI003981D253
METSNIITLLISLISFINIALGIAVIFFERRDVGYTWAWLLILFTVPVVGFLIYIFLGRQVRKENFYKLTDFEKSDFEMAVNRELEAVKEHYSHNEMLDQYSDLINMNLNSSNAFLTTDNEINIFTTGQEKFASLFEDIKKAKEEVNIQYYIIQPDNLGKQLRDLLVQKAKEGVKVRLLFDAIGSKKISPSFYQEIIKNGGEVEVFFPSFLRLINFRINNRNHRKLCIIDGNIAYIGGFNVGDEYMGMKKKFGYWRDTHLKITGNAVNHVQARFILDWVYSSKAEQVAGEDFSFTKGEHNGNSPVQIVSSGPNSKTEHLKNMYVRLIMSAKKSIYIQTPYFIPDASFMDACKMALLSGVDLRIMIPNKPDHPFVYWATWAFAGELLSYGAKIYLYEKGFLHAKTIVVDQKTSSVGTTNIDNRSFKLNFEVNATVYDKAIADELAYIFHEDIKNCSHLTIERYEERPLSIKFKEAISRLLAPIL